MEGNINFTGNLSGSIDAGGGSGTSNYNALDNKPKINNVTLTGNKTNQQLGIPTGTYNELTGKPSINDVELTGNRTTADLGLFSGNYNDLTNKPTIFDGDYTDLAEKPTINNVELIGNRTTEDLGLFSGAYADLTGKPALKTVATTGSYDDLIDKPTIPAAQVNADWTASSGVAEILHKPTLAAVATSGSYIDLTDKPSIPAAQVNADWDAESGVAQILNKPTIPAAQVNSDWDAASGVAQILNKPTIPSTAAQISYDNTTSGLTATDTQDAIDEVNSSLAQLGAMALPLPNTNKFTCSVYNCTASNVFTDDLNYIINGDYLILCGRARITISSRTGGNCGLKVTIPNSKTITLSSKCTNYVSPSYYSDGFRNGEATMLEFDSGTNDYFYIRASESYANVGTKILCFTIPMTIIKLDS